jgi:hypothetical protein
MKQSNATRAFYSSAMAAIFLRRVVIYGGHYILKEVMIMTICMWFINILTKTE